MKTLIASLIAVGLVTSAASAASPQDIFTDIQRTAPKSLFDQINETAPRTIFDEIQDTAPRSIFDDIRDTAPHDAPVFQDLQRTAP
jgi:hypothetical protein